MAEVHAYVFSMLTMQRLTLQEGFLAKHPGAWIIWEPVVWKPSALNPNSSQTLPVSFSTRPQERPEGDALCFELSGTEPVKLGRAPDCDIRINDGAVSREHLWLRGTSDATWRLTPASPSAKTLHNGEPLTSEGTDLLPGDELRVGGVILRFEDAATMSYRLDRAAQGH
ncbi:MAG: FHA domain-containing protein [Myxococcota bacterium]|nr:FHA domain-containing protein [Myxococcota bacterium]